MESNALKDGSLSAQEKARIRGAQNRESRDITRLDNNNRTGDPNSLSSRRMQADVQRNVNQQQRIEQGVKSGSLTNREVGRRERGEPRITRREARAGRDGHVGPGEQRRIQSAENRESRRIYRQKHDDQVRN